MSKPSKPVFISYARQASREHAEALYLELGDDLAFLDSEDIPFGDAFPERLVDALLDSRVVVILAEPVYFTRWYCLLEYRLARTPFLRLSERSGVSQRERDAALQGIVVAMPPGDADPMLERFPAAVQARNWAPATDPAAVATLVRARLSEGLPTLRDRYAALGELGTIHDIVLETTLLPGPGRIGKIPLVPVIGLSPSLHDRFVGRSKDIFRLHDVLTTERGEMSAAALTGAIEAGGGFGKTRLALEYLYRFGTRHFRGGLFWINAEQDVESQLYDVVQALDPSAPDVAVLRTAQGGVAGALARLVRSRADVAPPLFVIDNVPETESGKPPLPLSHWCPVLGEVAVLATSRRRLAPGGAGSIVSVQIDTLEPAAAVRLLTAEARREELKEDEWTGIADWVGNLPLALELLNGLLTSSAMSARELLEMSREQGPSKALDEAMDVLRGTVPEGTLRGITQAFAESYERLTEEEQYAARLLAWMAPAVVPDAVLEAIEDDPIRPSVRAALRGRNFVTPPAGASPSGMLPLFGSMHRVLADFLRSRSTHGSDEINVVLSALLHVIEVGVGDDRLRVAGLIGPAVAAVAVHRFDSSQQVPEGTQEDIDSHLNVLCVRLLHVGSHSWAQACAEVLVRARRRVLGEEHPHTLTSMNNLGTTLRVRGDYAGAQEIHERVLAVRRRVLGEEHPDTLTSMNNLATVLSGRGDHTGAQEMYERVLAARRRILGEEHPDTLFSINNLAATLWARGDHARALEMEQHVLAARRRILGEEHPDTLTSMNNLAETLRTLGDHAGAQALHERVLSAMRRVLGEDHPDTLASMNNLAETLSARGDYAGAWEMHERVLAATRRVLGEEHPDTLTSMNNLAAALRARGDHAGAQEMYESVLAARRRILGEEHPHTLVSMNNLAAILRERGDLAEAKEMHERVLASRRRILGEEHPDTLSTKQHLATTLWAQGDYGRAERLEVQVLAGMRRIFGEQHPLTSRAAWSLYITLRDSQKAGEARRVLSENLLWLLERDPGTLFMDQRKYREQLPKLLNALEDPAT